MSALSRTYAAWHLTGRESVKLEPKWLRSVVVVSTNSNSNIYIYIYIYLYIYIYIDCDRDCDCGQAPADSRGATAANG